MSQSPKQAPIPKPIREQAWIETFGETFKHKCHTERCNNEINVFSFQVRHNKPESKGGSPTLSPICNRCNLSLSNIYPSERWNDVDDPSSNRKRKCCF